MERSDKCKACPCEDLCLAGLPPPSGCPKSVESKDFFTDLFGNVMRKSNES